MFGQLFKLAASASASAADDPTVAWWDNYGPILGVVIGALLTAVLTAIYQLVVANRNHHMTQVRQAAALRQSEYFMALDVTYDMENAISEFGGALSGRYEPDEDDDSPDAEAQRQADENAAEAVGALFFQVGQLKRSVMHIEAVGSPSVQKLMQDLDDLLAAYMTSQFDESSAGVFRAAAFNDMRDEFRALQSNLAKAIRADLKVDKIYRSH